MAAHQTVGRTGKADRDAQDSSRSYLAALQPLVRVGVTGHRDLVDAGAASRSATEALCQVLTTLETVKWPVGMFRSVVPSATVLGYRIISSLAEGADRLVASLVLSPDPRLSHRARELVVPLPFRLDYYRGCGDQLGSDCSSQQSQAEFDRLRCVAVWTRSLHPSVPANSAQREAWYEDAGHYVVSHCDLLFALWDGTDNAKRGGTAATVRFALEQGIPVIWIPVRRQAPESAPQSGDLAGPCLLATAPPGEITIGTGLDAAIDLASPRAQAALTTGHQPRSPGDKPVVERLARLEELCLYGRENSQLQREIGAKVRSASPPGQATDDVLGSVADWIIPAHVITDRLAKRYQYTLKFLNIGVYAAAALAVTLGAFAAIMFPDAGYWRLLVVFEAAVLITLLAVQWQDLRKKCRDRWVAYRAMSEYFRVGRFLGLVTPQVASGLEYGRFARLYSWSSRPDTAPWFAPVIERIWERRPALDLQGIDVTWLRHYLIAEWVDGQVIYHENRRDAHLRWDRRFQRIIRVILVATVLIVTLHVLMDYFPGFIGEHHHNREILLRSLALGAIVLTSIAAAFNGYAGQQRHNYHYERFRRMADELKVIRNSASSATTMDELRRYLGQTRRVTLGEATSWYEGMQEQLIDSPS